MNHREHHSLLMLAALTWALLSCNDCEREGCDALGRMAPRRETGVAGVVAMSSDLVINGCQECLFGEANLELWRTDTPITTETAAIALLDERASDVTEIVSGHYRRALEPGPYLLCVRPSCVALTVAADETLTVNIKRRDGATGFFVGNAGLEEDFGFDVGY